MTENRTLQLDYLVNDTTYPGLQGTVLLHFNVTILPVQIRFANITHMFSLTRRASPYAQVPLDYLLYKFKFPIFNHQNGKCECQILLMEKQSQLKVYLLFPELPTFMYLKCW